MRTITESFKQLAKFPEIKNAKFFRKQDGKELSLSVNWSYRNLAKMERLTMKQDFVVNGNKVTSTVPVPVTKIVLSSFYEVDQTYAYIEQDEEKQYIYIINKDGLVSAIDLKSVDAHGKIYSDIEFSCLAWSPDGNKLAYVAEKKKVKATHFFHKNKKDEKDGRGLENAYNDSWGEQLTDLCQSVIVVVEVASENVVVHELSEGLCPGQLVWTPDGTGIVGVAINALPFKLGLIYCRNRDSRLFHLTLDGKFSETTIKGHYVQAPRFSPDGSRLLFMRSPVGGPHIREAQLVLFSWPMLQESVLLDYISEGVTLDCGSKFYGLTGDQRLPERCWTSDSLNIIFSADGPFNVSTYIVNCKDGKIRCLKSCEFGNEEVMDVYCDSFLLKRSSFVNPQQILVGHFEDSTYHPKYVTVSPSVTVDGLNNMWMDFWQIPMSHQDPTYADLTIPCLYFGPTEASQVTKKYPLIVLPHGGPHSCSSNMFTLASTLFVKQGYGVLFINYRGSLGKGSKHIHALPGYCGEVDVTDVYKATKSCLSRNTDTLNPSEVVLFGGSHGGFLVTHLAAQYPDMYKAVSARNPVIDISAMSQITDIIDWCYVEAGNDYAQNKTPTQSSLVSMFDKSPIKLIDNVKAPVLMLIGKNDERVPPSQGIFYYKLLLAKGIKTKLFVYDDCHPLNKVDVEVDTLIHTLNWFNECLGKV